MAMSRLEELRQKALLKVREEEFDEAIALYDEALSLAENDESRELIIIKKADALIAAGRGGAEVQALPAILMRRRNLHHTFLAAYALTDKHRLANDPKRAIFYGQIALDAAVQANEDYWKLAALNGLGIIYEIDSQFSSAIECLESALELLECIGDESMKSFSYVAIRQNLGYNKILVGDVQIGITMIESVLNDIQVPSSRSDSLIDLCYGYLELEKYEVAQRYGQAGLELATDPRQLRNAHYLLGETAYKLGDQETADHHFDELARYYPQFRNLKTLLMAVDLRSMINLKL
jgi:tetratricopeptide (TPR) repeat protein